MFIGLEHLVSASADTKCSEDLDFNVGHGFEPSLLNNPHIIFTFVIINDLSYKPIKYLHLKTKKQLGILDKARLCIFK